jgi:superfamily II DNA/RNA helicase/cold shock CspA family protein
MKALRRGTDVLVACPGRLQDLLGRGEVDLGAVELVVVDEADRMADMGFLPEVRRLLDRTPATRQTLLFSATLDGGVDALVRAYQSDPVRHEVPDDPDRDVRAVHHFWSADRDGRVDLTAEIVRRSGSTIVFCRTKHGTDSLARKLGRLGVRCETIHGNRSQAQRERALGAFASGKVSALLATDVAARGIHVDGVDCVVHFDPPADEKDYTHRSGRTARAGATGQVVSIVLADQVKAVRRMQRTLDLDEGVTAPELHALAEPPAIVTAPRPVEPVGGSRGPVPAVVSAPTAASKRPRGTVKFFDTRRGFGFIDRGTGTDLFVHHTGLDVAGHRLEEGQLVEFEIAPGRRGEEARGVRLARSA